MNPRRHSVAYLLVLAAIVSGCGDTDDGTKNISLADTTFSVDGTLYVDAGPDTGATDTGAPDTGAPTGPTDTSSAADTSAIDVGKGSDDGTCPSKCDDSLPCTLDSCANGACSHALQPGYCLAGGVCLLPGPVQGSPCLACKPEVASLSLQPAEGAACDDGVDCTVDDACDAKGNCSGTPSAGCCKSDLDCTSGAPCLAAVCDLDSGACKTEPKKNCCEQGVCCNPTTFSPHLAGTPCGTTPKKTEWACDGANVRRRDGVDACDGASAGTCGQGTVGLAWKDWVTVSTCPQGQVCALKDSATKPTCATAPDCTSDAQCNDGKVCTQDLCKNGSCEHPPSASGVPCGSKPLKTEYKCSSASKGGAIQVRYAVSTCNGTSTTCPTSSPQPVWGQWQTVKFCGFNEVCEVKDSGKPGACVGAPQCKPGSTCCDDAGKYAAKGTQCGDKVVKTEAKCEGSKGGKLLVREAKPGCSGSSTTCFSYSSSYFAWSEWKLVKQCTTKETCEVKYTGDTGSCTTKTQCNPSSTCCDGDGFFEPKGSKCGTSPWKTEQKCVKKTKGDIIQERQGWRGCSGTSTYCSTLSTNLFWEPWKDVKTCAASATCEVSFGKAECVTQCNPTQACCSKTGEYEPKGTKCGSFSVKTEEKCSGTGKGADVLEREAFYGCTGKSGSCSYSSTNYTWSPWKVIKSCAKHESCEAKYGSASCKSVCNPTQACCTDLGEYEAKGTQCSKSSSKTETKCSDSGDKVLQRKAYRGCTGSSYSCSYSSTYYVWGPWETKTKCSSSQVCKGSFSHYCGSK